MKARSIFCVLLVLTLGAMFAAVVIRQQQRSLAHAGARPMIYEVQGIVREVDVSAKTIRITHEEIANYMPGMTMPFSVKEAALLKGVFAGDKVQFELVVTSDDSWIKQIERIPADAPMGVAAADTAPVPSGDREAGRVGSGERVPGFALVDQDGRPIQLSDYRGRAVVLTFIYTRCPLPNFCPLMSKNFAELQRRLDKEFAGRYQLLSVSMDPEFDRPAVLKEYAARYQAGPHWTFATGDAEQIQFVAELLGLSYTNENGLISHDLRTALIGPDGRLVHLWKSNVWTPYEVQRLVREVLTGCKDVAAR